jgi:hypothetical protein
MNFTNNNSNNKKENENNGRFASLLNSEPRSNPRDNSRDNSRNYPRDNSRNYPRDNSRNYPRDNSRNYPRDNSRSYESMKLKQKPKEYNIMEEDFPEINTSNDTSISKQPCLNYIEKCKLIKEEQINKDKLETGWYCITKNKKTKQLLYSNNGIDFIENYEDLKTEEEKEKENKLETDLYNKRALNIFMEFDNSRRQASIEYYETCGELDEYALAEIDRLEYEEYEKQFEMIETEEDIRLENEEYVSE